MERSDPSASAPASSNRSPEGFRVQPVPGFKGTVVISDPLDPRLQAVCNLISMCGAHPRLLRGPSGVSGVESSPRSAIAIVALRKCPRPDEPALELVRELKKKGFKVLCYEDGAALWPLGGRSLALLAGAQCTLDSAAEGFFPELGRWISRLLDEESRRRDEEAAIREVMVGLGLVGESQAMISVFRKLLRVSMLSDLSALITGETGTGKELVAHAIHHLDPKRNEGPFIALNCAAVAPSLAESEFFGHRRGAFTGANQDRKGLIRAAEGGVLLLDEVGEMELSLQPKLLRVLQEGRVLGVGEDRDVSVNVRVLAASNRDLSPLVHQGRFRADLFHRLSVLSIRIPPLRERPEDIRPLTEYFLEKSRMLWRAESVSVAPDFIEALAQVELPGNVRQLENLIRRALAHKENDAPLSLTDLPAEIWRQLSGEGRGVSSQPDSAPEKKGLSDPEGTGPRLDPGPHIAGLLDLNEWNLSRSLGHCEKIFLGAALRRAKGNQTQTARLLGITPRSVYNKIRKHHLPF